MTDGSDADSLHSHDSLVTDADTTYIYNSGGAQSGLRFNTWSDLITALGALSPGNHTIQFEQDETIPAGAWDLNGARLFADGALSTGIGGPPRIVTFADGATLTNLNERVVASGLALFSVSTTPVITLADEALLTFGPLAMLMAQSAPLIQFTGTTGRSQAVNLHDSRVRVPSDFGIPGGDYEAIEWTGNPGLAYLYLATGGNIISEDTLRSTTEAIQIITATGAEQDISLTHANAASVVHEDLREPTWPDGDFRVADGADLTKQIAFDAANITTGTTRTITMSDADVDLDDVHAESHTVASHSDTTATGAELETLTDGSDADSLHTHDGKLDDVVDDTTPQLGGTLDAVTNSIENLGAVEEEVNTVAASGATETLDVSTYGVHDVTMDEACTFTFSNPAPSGDASSFALILRGAFTPTLPASVDWPDGAAPTYTTPTVFVFWTVDAGTTWLGSSPGKAYA